MRILGIESSSLVASAAIVEDNVLLGEFTINHKKTHSQTLLPMIDGLFKMLDIEPDTVDAIAVAGGPGSFTGLRIGSATAKGLGLALNRPLIGIPTLESMAYNMYKCDAVICPIMDAKRNQVYAGVYRFEDENPVKLFEQQAVEIDRLVIFLDELSDKIKKEIVFLGDGVPVFGRYIGERLKSPHFFAPPHLNRQRAGAVASLGLKYYNEGKAKPHGEHVPVYLRKSQAEMVRDGRMV